MSLSELANSLVQAAKECECLWSENKNLQGQFINDLSELQTVQAAVANMSGSSGSNGMSMDQAKLASGRQTLERMQRQASQLYQTLLQKRQQLMVKLNDGAQQVLVLQQDLINVQLLDWKRRQKLAQIGAPFLNREELLDNIQTHFEMLAEHNWQLRTYASWLLDLVQRMPSLPDNSAQTYIANLGPLIDNLTKLLWMLVSQSFIVSQQPDPVLKTQHKFSTEVRLLIGDKLGIKQQIDNANVTVKIIGEDQARQQIQDQSVKAGVGNISNDFEKLQLDEKGHMAAKFSNSKLTRIAPRKPAQRGSDKQLPAAVDQKYGLLFHISPFQLGNLGTFDVWTLSLPIMVTVHGCQDCDAQANILWHRAFGDVNWASGTSDINVTWPQLAEVLRWKFQLFTGVQRPLDSRHLSYLSEKLCGTVINDLNAHMHLINFSKFAKTPLPPSDFSFWDWFFNVMQLIRSKLQVFWDEGWCIGFVSKGEATHMLQEESVNASFLLRFSDTTLGGVSISFVTMDDLQHKFVSWHLAPFVVRELDQLSLPQRIATCKELQHIRYLYGDIDKNTLLMRFENEDRNKSPTPNSDTSGYIPSEVIMVVKATGRSTSVKESPVPSPGSAQSPGEAAKGMAAMDLGDSSSPKQGPILYDSDTSLSDILGPNPLGFLSPTPAALPQLDLNVLQAMAPYNMDMSSMVPRPPPPYSNPNP